MLKTIRRVLAFFVFVFITLMFLDFTGTVNHWFGWLPMIQFIPAVLALHVVIVVALLLLTAIFGRIYCSVICPLGIFQDIVAHFHVMTHNRFAKKKHKYEFKKELPVLRWFFLCLFCIVFALGIVPIAALIEPYSAFGRMATNLFAPLYGWANNGLAAVAEHFGSYAFYSTEVWVKGGVSLLVSFITLAVIVAFAFTGRTYCNTICPVGTLLGVVSRFSWFKVQVDESKCNKCGQCARSCKAHCIDSPNGKVDYSRCVVCGNCLGKCKQGALKYTHKTSKSVVKETVENPTDAGRRAFLIGAAAATVGAAYAQEQKKVDGGLAAIVDKKIPERKKRIVPPGAVSLEHLAQHCTACQLCISNCPNDVLRPSTDLEHIMQPEMSYERGYCRPECNRCSDVCPTGAIRLVDLPEKCSTKIGTARIIAENCVTGQGVHCGNCARHCPVGAITMVNFHPDDENAASSPVIDAECCIGCGACENLCPVRPISAIIVDGIDQQRTI